MIFFLSYSSFDLLKWYSRKPDRLIDGLTDRWKDRPSYKDAHDASSEPSILPLSTICSKILISFVFDESVTDQRTDGRTDGRTDRPGYRDARTHLKMADPGRLTSNHGFIKIDTRFSYVHDNQIVNTENEVCNTCVCKCTTFSNFEALF